MYNSRYHARVSDETKEIKTGMKAAKSAVS